MERGVVACAKCGTETRLIGGRIRCPRCAIETQLKRIGVDYGTLGSADCVVVNIHENGITIADDGDYEDLYWDEIEGFLKRLDRLPNNAGREIFWNVV